MRLFRVFPVLAAVCLCAFSILLFAQTRVLREIFFPGAPGYSQAELLAFTGLKPGGSATQQQLDDAAQRLNDTGLFDEVNFAGNDKGIVYTLKPAPASAMLPVRLATSCGGRMRRSIASSKLALRCIERTQCPSRAICGRASLRH